ncbi:MAG: hypothetical protein B7Z82_08375 [Halothiobacillus sp. 20-54-6]|nr:MAG: hypothetical protein B7Z82_08375 [Halothiobacillus sp. 20-54-6]
MKVGGQIHLGNLSGEVHLGARATGKFAQLGAHRPTAAQQQDGRYRRHGPDQHIKTLVIHMPPEGENQRLVTVLGTQRLGLALHGLGQREKPGIDTVRNDVALLKGNEAVHLRRVQVRLRRPHHGV